ncbi:MAG: hypothetical protein IPJ61_18350 [Tessaracoccus sp.]|uniref:hypothetical protein n=1 Tax=Tessaracoccus sp. TaxID=1971211 RepID=UPI001ED59BD9|nr:hypothetical protein [Tessaracoccus sp.]MBK7822946.1 hypothetical protein [Tessaracoccus sp.]
MNIWFRILSGLLLAAAVFGFGYRQGWFAGDSAARRELEPKIVALNAEKVEAERQAVAVREASRLKADKLAADLLSANTRITSLQRRVNDEIRARTSAVDRAVGAAAVKLLNELSPIRSPGRTGAPAAAAAVDARPDGSSAAAADSDRRAAADEEDDGSGASERAVALALSERGTLYERCRIRFTALVAHVRSVSQ